MAIITTGKNSYTTDSVQRNKGTLTVIYSDDGLGATINGTYALLSAIKVDGASFTTIKELSDELDEKVFRKGGSTGGNGGTGVELPQGTERDVLTWDAQGDAIAARINAWHLTDINGRPPFSFGVLAGASLQDDKPFLLFTEASNVAKSGTLPVYKSNGRISAGVATEPDDAINLGQINGFLSSKADVINGKVPESFLPSYIDNVQEFDNIGSLPDTGLDNVIYVTTDDNKPFRWNGSSYTQISSGVVLGETMSTAYRGDRGKESYDHVQSVGNPHGTTKEDIGLGSVDNTSDLSKPISTATSTALGNKANAVHTHNITAIVNLQSSLDGKQNLLKSGTNIKTVGGVSILGSGNIATDVLFSSSTSGAIVIKEYSNRTEYTFKIPFNQSVPAAGTSIATGYFLPVGVTFNNASEHYISVRNDQRDINVVVFDGEDRRIIIGLGNIGNTTVTASGSVSVKVVKNK